MKQIKILGYFLKLIRWPNLLIIIITMSLMRYCILRPMLLIEGMELQMSFPHFLLLVGATTLISAAGYIINDYFDRKTDLINKPYKVIVGRFIKRRIAIIMHTIFNILGVLAGIYISYKNDLNFLSIIFIVATGILWFYSTNYKRQVFIGNLVIAILTATVPLLVISFELPLLNRSYKELLIINQINLSYLAIWVTGFAYFAFITTLIREIIKDAEDLEGDQAYGRTSIPLLLGFEWTKRIVFFIIIIMISSIAYILFRFINDIYSIIYLCIFIIIPCIYLQFVILKACKKSDYTRASKILKIIMIFGILYSVLVNYIISFNL